MRTQIRIVAGSLRGRKLTCTVNKFLRPTPQRVREALFSILGNAVPGRPFLDLFAGTGVIGLEALSRDASSVLFVERDFHLVQDLERHLREFDVADRGSVARVDVYRWVERYLPPSEPITVFFSPPFDDLKRQPEVLLGGVAELMRKAAPGSVLVLQSETGMLEGPLPSAEQWERRRYGRNELLIWVKE